MKGANTFFTQDATSNLISDSTWKKVKLPILKWKHQKFLTYKSEVTLSGCHKPLRQIIMKDHGRAELVKSLFNFND